MVSLCLVVTLVSTGIGSLVTSTFANNLAASVIPGSLLSIILLSYYKRYRTRGTVHGKIQFDLQL